MEREGARVLVVEEDAFTARYLTCLLERAGLPPRIASGVDEATAALRELEVDLVLVNAHVTGDGLELVHDVTTSPRSPAVGVLTTEATPVLRRRARAAGAGQLIELPLASRELVYRLRYLLGSVASHSAAAARVSLSSSSRAVLRPSGSAATRTALCSPDRAETAHRLGAAPVRGATSPQPASCTTAERAAFVIAVSPSQEKSAPRRPGAAGR